MFEKPRGFEGRADSKRIVPERESGPNGRSISRSLSPSNAHCRMSASIVGDSPDGPRITIEDARSKGSGSDSGSTTTPRDLLLGGLHAALDATGGYKSVHRRLMRTSFDRPCAAFAVGKASAFMMAGAVEALGERIERGLVITRHGYAEGVLDPGWPVELVESSHPVPDASSIEAGRRLIDFLQGLPPRTMLLAMISGGASALVECLPAGFGERDLARVNRYLLGSGYPIGTINRVRKRISLIKAGRLSNCMGSQETLNLLISDVPGDDPKVIGSGLLIPHTPADIDTGDIDLPNWLTTMARSTPDLPRAEEMRSIRSEIIARPADARMAAAAFLRKAGFDVIEHEEILQGDAVEAGDRIGRMIADARPGDAHLWVGETTVRLPPNPKRGGRCQSLALAAARQIAGKAGAYLLAAGTDGSDGPGEVAGAIVDAGTADRGQSAAPGSDLERSLRNADAGTWLEAACDLVHTGPTGTNVMDLIIALRAKSQVSSARSPSK
ncbi:glycerate kinase type-2 family protein [Thioalkalivibrio sp. HK1]|uniref:glycerate kinase type-2 family protein n=1 Tax=Thioalkalivibrio sp. HK1 TaxID=1469245 RepID=UPI0004B61B35|nr:DUF4147 domain-containing protein [Thioalkalivibrio sp. HK1]